MFDSGPHQETTKVQHFDTSLLLSLRPETFAFYLVKAGIQQQKSAWGEEKLRSGTQTASSASAGRGWTDFTFSL
jgi:hypothetical protein